MKSNKIIVIIIIVLLIICAILGCFIAYIHSKKDTNVLTEGDINKVVATVNGEDIAQLDLNYKKYVESEKDTNDEEVKKDVIKDKVTIQEARKNNIDISDEEKQKIKDNITSTEVGSDDKATASSLNMSEEDFLNYIVNKQIENSVISKYKIDLATKLFNKEINDVDDEEFNKVYEELKNYSSDDLNEKANNTLALVEKATDTYINYLVKIAKLEYK